METPTQTKAKKLPKLTKRQRGFVRDYVQTENGTQAALKHYNAKNNLVAKSIASENLTKPYILDAIEVERLSLKNALVEAGITPQRIAEKINVLLNASDDERPDYTAVDKGLKHATTIYGIEDLDTKKPTTATYNFIFSSETQADVKSIEEKIKARLIQKHEPTQAN